MATDTVNDGLSNCFIVAASSRRRIAVYLILGLGVPVAYAAARDVSWQGGVQSHTAMEAVATMLAAFVGAIAMLRYHACREIGILFVGAGFLGAAFLDGHHMLATSASFQPDLSSEQLPTAPWSWVASRQFLAVFLALSSLAWILERKRGRRFSVNPVSVYLIAAVLAAAIILVTVSAPLPRIYYPEWYFSRPGELGPIVFFTLALIAYLYKGEWRDSSIDHWLVMTLIVGLTGQAILASFSGAMMDIESDIARTLKIISYLFALIGFFGAVNAAQERSESLTRNLKIEISKRHREHETLRRLQGELQDNEEKARTILETIADGVVTIDSRGTIRSFNSAAEKLFGYQASEVHGKNVKLLMPSKHSDAHDNHLQLYLTTGKSAIIGVGRELVAERKDKSTFDIELALSEMKIGDQRMFTGVIRDISQRKRDELELKEFSDKLQQLQIELREKARTTLETIADGVVTIDANGTIDSFNSAATNLFGYTAAEVYGQNVKMLMPDGVSKHHDGFLKAYLETGKSAIIGVGRVLVAERKDKSKFDMELAISEMRIGEKRMFTGVIRDISQRKRDESDLAKYAEDLRQSNSELEQFASVASHDLQEPLRKVRAFGDRLQRKFAEQLGDQGKDYIDRMNNSTARMQVLIDDLLAFSRISSKVQPYESVDLNEIVKGVADDLELRIRENNAELKIGDLPTIDADALQMRQLFQNLIGNAIKYRRPDADPIVRITAHITGSHASPFGDKSSRVCHIEISDNGIGFCESYAEKIFGIFQRLHGRSEYEGTGVGLAICKKIVERHGGSIEARARENKGATFVASLPVSHEIEEVV